MIRRCEDFDFEAICAIVNDGAQAYKGIIPEDCWTEPYMSEDELRHEIEDGVEFWGEEIGGELVGVMGLQYVQDAELIRHAYVRTTRQKQGIGARLLAHLLTLTSRPVLIGTWAAAVWAIRFYESHGFKVVQPWQKDLLLKEYWTISERQIETSVVLADQAWQELNATPFGVVSISRRLRK